MKLIRLSMISLVILFSIVIAGCGSSKVIIDKEASTSAIRGAEEVGAANISSASLYLQLAKEGLVKAEGFAEKGEKEKAESMLLRARTDGELAIALSRSDTEKKEATKAIERSQQLRKDNKLTQ